MDYRIIEADWQSHEAAIRRIRAEVFTHEQSVPEEEEWDEWDECSRYVLAIGPREEPLGTGRLTPAGQIGRMAVLRPWRGNGIGGALLEKLIELARNDGFEEVFLHSQYQVLDFYDKYGFMATGPEFREAGIRHRKMILKIQSAPNP